MDFLLAICISGMFLFSIYNGNYNGNLIEELEERIEELEVKQRAYELEKERSK